MGEPPVWADPRRRGSLIGLIGGMVFIVSSAAGLNSIISVTVQIVGLGLVGAALFAH